MDTETRSPPRADTARAATSADILRAATSADTTLLWLDGRYGIDPARALPGAGAGLPAFAVQDRAGPRRDLMALRLRAPVVPYGRALQSLLPDPAGEEFGRAIPGILCPLAYGWAGPGLDKSAWLVCQAPPGAPLASLLPDGGLRIRNWTEAELMADVLRPAGFALEALRQRGLTHRAIRPDNLFQAAPGQPVLLGCAWATAPGALQHSLYEPPYSAACAPYGRGEGTIADDVYALGVCLVVLALGRLPLATLDEHAVLRRKIAQGSLAALTEDLRLPPAIQDLARGMLAEDPEHRPPPLLLTDPRAARSRRVAARPVRTAQAAFQLPGAPAADDAVTQPRMLAQLLARNPEPASHALRLGQVEHWLRRALGDGVLASQVDDLVRDAAASGPASGEAGDYLLVARAVAVLDPLAPLCWGGVMLWPDALGSMLAAAPAEDMRARLGLLVAQEGVTHWASQRTERCDATGLRYTARQWRSWMAQPMGGGLARVRHMLNPLDHLDVPGLGNAGVMQPAALLLALELWAARPDRPKSGPIGPLVLAFLASHDDQVLAQLGRWSEPRGPEGGGLAAAGQLQVCARLQEALRVGGLPALTAWLAELTAPALQGWRNLTQRTAQEAAVVRAAKTGHLASLVAALGSTAALAADARAAETATALLRQIDQALDNIRQGSAQRAARARLLGHQATGSLAWLAAALALALALA